MDKEDYEGGAGVGIVREIKIETGWHGFEAGHDFWKYWRPFKNKDEMKPAFFSAKETMETDKKLKDKIEREAMEREAMENNESYMPSLPKKAPKVPAKAIKITIYPDSEDKGEMRDLYAVWMEDKYAAIAKSLRENELPLHQKFWGRISYTPDPDAVAKGEEGKTESYNGNATFPNIRVPVQAFKNKQEAMEFVKSNQPAQSSNGSYSDVAMSQFTKETLESCAEDILADVKNTYEGIPHSMAKGADLPIKPTSPNPKLHGDYEQLVLEYVAVIWEIEVSDITKLYASSFSDPNKTIFGEEIPF